MLAQNSSQLWEQPSEDGCTLEGLKTLVPPKTSSLKACVRVYGIRNGAKMSEFLHDHSGFLPPVDFSLMTDCYSVVLDQTVCLVFPLC